MTIAAHAASRSRIKLIFLLQAIASGTFFTRIPDLQAGLALDAGTLGLAFIGQPVGAIAMFLFASSLVERLGTRLILLYGLPLLALTLFSMALAPSALLLSIAVALNSGLFALTSVTMNVEADRIEAASGQRLMNTCHALWSLGQLSVFLIGVLLRGLGVPVSIHFGLFVPLILIGTLALLIGFEPAPARGHTGGVRARFALPSAATLRLLGFMLGGSAVESATRTWSVIYARDSFDAPGWADGLTLPVFVGAVGLCRFFADNWTHRFGPARLARGLMAVALAGAVVIVFAPSLPIALFGFALLGFGIGTTFPASTSAAAQLGDRPASENVAALTMSVQTVMLGAPALMGAIANVFDARAIYVTVLPMLALALILSRGLEPKPVANPADR